MRHRLTAAAVLVVATMALSAPAAHAMSARQHVEHARTTLHAAHGTLRFFSRRQWLVWDGPLARRRIAKGALRVAYARITAARSELVRAQAVLVIVTEPPADALTRAFLCIHSYEGSWTANTGNGYYGGMQMDAAFELRYGGEFVHRWGTANNWPVWAQLVAARRAYLSGRGFWPWPNTARLCRLL